VFADLWVTAGKFYSNHTRPVRTTFINNGLIFLESCFKAIAQEVLRGTTSIISVSTKEIGSRQTLSLSFISAATCFEDKRDPGAEIDQHQLLIGTTDNHDQIVAVILSRENRKQA